MPELPEVHGYKTYIDSTALHQTIIDLECRDNRLLKKSTSEFNQHLLNQKFKATHRIGKYLFIETTGKKILVIHFGMTGRPNYYKSEEDRPKFGHLQLKFDNGYHFAFENKRKFGWWDLTDSIAEFKVAHKLSDDARDLSFEDFRNSLTGRKTDIKKIIMDQSVAAGVGNWMADEILYQSKIHPTKRVENMSDSEIKGVFDAMKEVIEVAISNEAHYSDFPEHFMMHFRKEGGICYHTGAEIKRVKVGGRATYFSPKWQKL